MKKLISLTLLGVMASSVLTGCHTAPKITILSPTDSSTKNLDFSFDVDPTTLELTVEVDGVTENISEALPPMEVSNLEYNDSSISWRYPGEELNISIEKVQNYLDINLESTSEETTVFTWPYISGKEYILPLQEGKLIPNQDSYWLEYLSSHSAINVMESLSMQFFSVSKANYALTYIMSNPFNNEINFTTDESINFSFTHEYPSINPNKTYGFRVYVTENNITDIAKTYKADRVSLGLFKTLREKAMDNPNISKLYGAPHIYFWDKSIITANDIDWKSFQKEFPSELKIWIQTLLTEHIEDGTELAPIFDEIEAQDYIDNYQKQQITKALNEVMQLNNFYNPLIFTHLPEDLHLKVAQGSKDLNRVALIELNKQLLKSELPTLTSPVSEWAKFNTVDVLKEMKDSGLEKAWIGFDDIESGYVSPLLVQQANDYGYLVGPYDSYHSIHKPGEEQWSTAQFDDLSLYEEATITDASGNKLSGFQNVGRKLNPTLSLPSVQSRISHILDYNYAFNSWFIDVDAAGEIHDDYSPSHITTQSQDLTSRLERMAYIRDNANMVIGSEGGNDYASTTIAFAHGLETPAFAWVDPDMKQNKESDYYVGRYYSPTGGVPEVFAKQIPLKELYNKIFISPEYSIPLFKLVYNDSVISSYQWLWGTFKIQEEVTTRMLREVLYNTPPMYHIDRKEWDKHQESIIAHNNIWIDFNKNAITKEMTDFEFLTTNRLVQMTVFEENLKVVANFSHQSFQYETDTIPPNTLVIYNNNQKTFYTPQT